VTKTQLLKNCLFLKFGDGDGPNLCKVKKEMLVPHLLNVVVYVVYKTTSAAEYNLG